MKPFIAPVRWRDPKAVGVPVWVVRLAAIVIGKPIYIMRDASSDLMVYPPRWRKKYNAVSYE